MSKTKITALYERLSVGDEQRSGESVSIKNQKVLLEQYAKSHGFRNTVHYTDDDESGRFFDRPGYVQMMNDVENGKIGIILLKDSSRLGRDYIQVGLAMETMRLNNVRLIGVEDGLDTNVEDDFIPFRNVLHEFYAKDASKKIKSVFKAKGMAGKHCTGHVAYGYLWDEKREHWHVDNYAADVVRSIFSMTMEGFGPYQIACKLAEKKIEIPTVHLARYNEGVNRSKTVKDIYGWGSSTVVHILKKREYLGHTCNFKTRKHFKDKKSHYVDESEWTIFENTVRP